MKKRLVQMERLVKIVHELRTQCPWDRKQTHQTLAPHLIEETFEAVDAIEKRNQRDLAEELGDVLLQVALHAEIASELKRFDLESIAKQIADKMVRRHPHIYSTAKYRSYRAHLKNWTESKAKEKPNRGRLGGLPTNMPALQLATRYGEIASTIGFDWPHAAGAKKKVEEEWAELLRETHRTRLRKRRVAEELGDLLLSLANYARHLGVDSESALRQANDKFRKRFTRLEQELSKRPSSKASPRELDAIWRKIKRRR